MTHSKSFKSTPPSSQGESATPPLLLRLGAAAFRQSRRIAAKSVRQFQSLGLRNQAIAVGLLGSALFFQFHLVPSFDRTSSVSRSVYPPLAMNSGDPYIRALMRTISVSESNDVNPYGLLYGGEHFSEWE